MRIALSIEYNGANYHGWQQQNGLVTIQSCVESAIAKVADQPIKIVCAGRTDVGVHAKGQVVHFDTEVNRRLDAWVFGVNCYLPSDICVKWAVNVDIGFHARFSAIARHYNYIIYNQKTRPAILTDQVAWHFASLDEKTMHQAGQYLLGEQDFSSFRSSSCQSRTPMRNIHHLKVVRHDDLVIVDIKANAFLQHMVRNIVGLLITIGEGKHSPLWAKEVLAKRDRCAAAYSAEACGLYLTNVYYPSNYQLPLSSNTIFFSVS
jgi:tRNA pseudouridine38-40 synthase